MNVNKIDVWDIQYVVVTWNNIISWSYVTDVSWYWTVFTNKDFKLSFYTFNWTWSVEDVQNYSLWENELVEIWSYEWQKIYTMNINNPLWKKLYQGNYVSLLEQSNDVVMPYEEYRFIMSYEDYIASIPFVFIEDEKWKMTMLFHNWIFRF